MGFNNYDYVFLALFVLFVIWFLSSKRKNLHRQGIIYLYKTQFGVRFIDNFAKRFRCILKPFQYVVLFSGYSLMAVIMWIMGKSVFLYYTTSITKFTHAPPIAPLIPYFPRIFGLEKIFPPLYFTYFLIALAIVAITHEAAHGIYARYYNFKIKSTGFVFLGPILGAFVEPDEKQMYRANKKKQLVVLGAGTFANILMTILFGLIMIIFFLSTFTPSGVLFDDYVYAPLEMSTLNILNGSTFDGYTRVLARPLDNPLSIAKKKVDRSIYYVSNSSLADARANNDFAIVGYENSPAFKSKIRGAIVEIGGTRITGKGDLQKVLLGFNPGDKVKIKTAILQPGTDVVKETRNYIVELGENEGNPFLGIAFREYRPKEIVGKIYVNTLAKIKIPSVHYDSKFGDFGWFIYYLLWWIVVINISVALFNMLPLGILDGGRFFLLSVWGLTNSEKIAKGAYKFMMWLILAVFIAMMVKWVFIFF